MPANDFAGGGRRQRSCESPENCLALWPATWPEFVWRNSDLNALIPSIHPATPGRQIVL